MIPGSLHIRQPAAWQQELARAITDPAVLVRHLGLDESFIEPARAAARAFPLRVPHGYLARMRPRDPADPLLRQVLPLGVEAQVAKGFAADPVGDRAAMAAPGVLHKYHGRVLLTVTGACAVHCRYCFRRHFPYADANPGADGWDSAVQYIARDPSIDEVILSGGDPLALSDARLHVLVERLECVAHLVRLRVHTRLPVVLPERVNDELIGLLAGSRFRPVVVLHVNHPNEIDAAVAHACERLRSAGVTLLNQSVLLAGVNDDAETLCRLSEALFAVGVLPYYLHQLDRVAGAAHFEVESARAKRLLSDVRARLPGYLVPRFVQEEAGRASKTWLV